MNLDEMALKLRKKMWYDYKDKDKDKEKRACMA